MSNLEVYFDNHNKAAKFPWSIYHAPLVHDLDKFLKENVKADSRVLVIGPGEFQEFSLLSSLCKHISILDIDPRVIESLQKKFKDRIDQAYLVDEKFNNYPSPESYDVVYAKEVIEHLVDYDKFLLKINSLLRTGGSLWLSTPNYGFFLLPLLEKTVLEFIAKLSGFSRKDIHPSKFSVHSLQAAIDKAGFKNSKYLVTPLKLALTVSSKK